MRFVPFPVFSCGMLPSLWQGNSHSVPPLPDFQWRLPHTFSAGISWWLRIDTPVSLPVLPPLPGRFRLAVPAFPLLSFSGSCGLPDVPIPPALRLPPLFWAAASSLSVLVFGCPAFCLSRHALCCAAFFRRCSASRSVSSGVSSAPVFSSSQLTEASKIVHLVSGNFPAYRAGAIPAWTFSLKTKL